MEVTARSIKISHAHHAILLFNAHHECCGDVLMLLLLEEEQFRSLPEDKRVLYILQWLQGLPPAIRNAPKVQLATRFSRLAENLVHLWLYAALVPRQY